MLPAQNRMTRSADFEATIAHGARVTQPDLVMYLWRGQPMSPPKVGLVVAKSVGGAVQRHRVARRLRHVARGLLAQLDASDLLVIRALPHSCTATSGELDEQLRAGLQRIRQLSGRAR
ncbi:ribonuclease P protein component [Mycobacterium sp.]|uniref:ribonuclease P protein component n=1 Tax=Mycobacterium sp. TaxID=1785 RepID=UPI0012835D86|nr:ribonuclease P protein component [Mycobacterium sp.]KAA8966495.1 MAG: ribonuclease P protein component [Mycobacterium sp.]